MSLRLTKLISLFLSFCLIFEQSVFAQSIDLSHYFANSAKPVFQSDKFRPLHLRYLGYDNLKQDFKLLLDKGDTKKEDLENKTYIEDKTQTLLKYFFIGLALPNEKFWVNLRPDAPDNIIDDDLAKTDIGRIFLEADVQLKKDTAGLTSPQTPEGKVYWDKLYKKAGELFGSENITIPTITRPWIVPNEIIIREAPDNAYIYKATLKVMLEEDYLRGTKDEGRETRINYSFNDPRLKELNEYSTQLIKETIIPKLTYEVNTSKRYAPLRQVYYSLILAQWFKQKYAKSSGENPYIKLIDSGSLTLNFQPLTSQNPYSKETYFKQYQKSFAEGEYNLSEPVYTPMGQSIRRYMSGGMQINCSSAIERGKIEGTKPLRLTSHDSTYLIPANTKGENAGSAITLPVVINNKSTNLQQLPDKKLAYTSPEDFLDKIKEFVEKKQAAFLARKLLGIKLGYDPDEIGKSLKTAEQILNGEIKKLINQGELIRTIFDPKELKEGDIVIMPEGDIGVYRGSKSANSQPFLPSESTGKENWGDKWLQKKALIEKQRAEWKPLTMYLFDSLGSSYSGQVIEKKDYDKYSIIRPHPVMDIKNNAGSSNISVSSSLMPPMVKALKDKFDGLGSGIIGVDAVGDLLSHEDVDEQMQWYLYAMPNNRYLEIFIKDNNIVAYGVTTVMPQNVVLRFHSFEKNAGRGDYWAEVYNKRIDKLMRYFSFGKERKIVIPTDQIISEDQLSKRIRQYIREKAPGESLDNIQKTINNIIKAVRTGYDLTDEEMEMATYKYPGGFYSFGLAANFYVNKLGFSLVPFTGIAPKKEYMSEFEKGLLNKLKDGKDLKESEIIELFSGRGMVLGASSPTQLPSKVDSLGKLSDSQEQVSSAVANPGGIDMRALPIQTEAVALSALGAFPGTNAFQGDIDAEWAQIQQVFNAGIRPSIQRISEYSTAAVASPLAEDKIDQVRVMLADILRRDEESEKLSPAEESCKQLLRALEAG